jgi:hypothetical protein
MMLPAFLGLPLTPMVLLPILRRHERPDPDLRHSPGDYSLASDRWLRPSVLANRDCGPGQQAAALFAM